VLGLAASLHCAPPVLGNGIGGGPGAINISVAAGKDGAGNERISRRGAGADSDSSGRTNSVFILISCEPSHRTLASEKVENVSLNFIATSQRNGRPDAERNMAFYYSVY
jgi:hypothetical protein